MTQLDSMVNGFAATRTDEFIVNARGLIRGVRILHDSAGPDAGMAFVLVAGHVLELALKAYVAEKDASILDALMKQRKGHELLEFWVAAVALGLPVQVAPPDWVVQLNKFHAAPYLDRYLKIESNAMVGVVIPTVRQELDRLFALIENQLSKF